MLEREAKIVYLDAVTHQLQARVQKAMDREASNETYLRELEAKLDGVSDGEEKHLAIIRDLRKELARIRESESSAEYYISTLEERLAEAEQDMDIMQRQVNRLEQVVERQRSVGKLDHLLVELDQIRNNEIAPANGHAKEAEIDSTTDAFHDRLVATTTGRNLRDDSSELAEGGVEEFWPDGR